VSDDNLAIEPVPAAPSWRELPTQAWRIIEPTPPTQRKPRSPVPTGPDPEATLAGYKWRFDPDTLREVLDENDAALFHTIRGGLTERLSLVADDRSRARLLSLRAVVARVLGDLQSALTDGRRALVHAEATAELRRVAIVQARLAHVLQWCGEYADADRLFAEANSSELPDRLRGSIHQHAGKCAYDQGRYIEACNHFELAMDLRKEEDPELIASTERALDAVFRRVAEHGWGPYPRTPEEILQVRRPPVPTYDEPRGRWGFAGPEGGFVIPARYVDAQPFREGVAWVQLPGALTWALIDEAGELLIQPADGYLAAGGFAGGLAWVSRDGSNRWVAINRDNRVVIPTGFDDVRPFRRGLAAVNHSGRWGAVDPTGRLVVPLEYDAFATALYDGRYIDGFSDEGLAVVVRDGLRGVVDHAGHILVPAVHAALVIHPVAFLFADPIEGWGALDRRGRLLVEPTHPSRVSVTEELDRLLADTKPIL
jgi:tetratricopeptide (TPR) repeat protein